MDKDYNKVILKRIDDVQGTVDRIDRDLSTDRHDIQDLTIRIGNLENVIEELRKGQSTMANKVSDKVSDKVEEAVDPIKKVLTQVKKEPFWSRFVKR